jgi:hypothetical protein
MSVLRHFFLFYRVFGCFSATGVQKHYKKRFTKKVALKNVYKKIDKKILCSFDLFYHVFGRFSVSGVQKHDKRNIGKINPTLVLFWPLTHPPTGIAGFFCRPLVCQYN